MRRSQRTTTTAAVVAGAAALALAATGIGAGPSAAQAGGTKGPATATARPATAGDGTRDGAGDGAGITLITGDHVVLDSRGKVARLRPAEGREAVPVQISEIQGHTYVLPSDTAGLIATGKLDRRLFDVTELSRPEYRQLVGDGVPLLVTYTGAGQRSTARSALRADTGATVRAEIDTVAGEALTVPGPGAGAAWAALTSRSPRATASPPESAPSGSTAWSRPRWTKVCRRSAPRTPGTPDTTARA